MFPGIHGSQRATRKSYNSETFCKDCSVLQEKVILGIVCRKSLYFRRHNEDPMIVMVIILSEMIEKDLRNQIDRFQFAVGKAETIGGPSLCSGPF
jgi:hypothetical protein